MYIKELKIYNIILIKYYNRKHIYIIIQSPISSLGNRFIKSFFYKLIII